MSNRPSKRVTKDTGLALARLIESDNFPCGFVSRLAEAESWASWRWAATSIPSPANPPALA